MNLSEIQQRVMDLTNRIAGINNWIRSNPHITDPNVYEIMDCNIQYAECVAELKEYYDKVGYPVIKTKEGEKVATIEEIDDIHPNFLACSRQIFEMDRLRDTAHHPFFRQDEPLHLYNAIQVCQARGSYELPKTSLERRIKRELLCKSMSVPFYIWQVHRENPNYKYDNRQEFTEMKEMLELCRDDGQFIPQVESLFAKIEKDYAYSNEKQNAEVKIKK